MLKITMRFLLTLISIFLAGTNVQAAKDTADFYHSAPQKFLGKEVPLRVASASPAPELTAQDPGYVWFEASTGKPKSEEGKIFLRIPAERSARISDRLNNGSASGNQVRGVFYGRENGPILPGEISKRVPYFLQMGEGASSANPQDLETAAGSLILPPKEAQKKDAPSPVASQTTRPPSTPSPSQTGSLKKSGPRAFLVEGKSGSAKELKSAKAATLQGDVWELTMEDGNLALLGKTKVLAVLPLPATDTLPTAEEVQQNLTAFDTTIEKYPDAKDLLLQAKAPWTKLAAPPAAVTASAPLPELEDVETAAGVEEPLVESGYPAWFLGSAAAALLLLILLGWAWSRPRSYSS